MVLSRLILHSAASTASVPEEWDRLVGFLHSALEEARGVGSTHILAFTHHPLFGRHPDEEDSPLVIPRERRRVLLDAFKAHGVSAVFSGHWHRNNYGFDGDLEVVTSAAVGYPLGDDPSGLRIVKVFDERIAHEYHGFGALPSAVEL